MDYLLLKRFCSTDTLRPAMLNPCKHLDGYTYATNGHVALKAKIKIPYERVPISEAPNVPGLFKQAHEQENANIPIDFLKMKNLLATVTTKSIYEPCEACDALGTIECEHCECENDCKQCNGLGFHTNKQIGKEFEIGQRIRIGNAIFDPKYIKLLTDLEKDFVCKTNLPSQTNLFLSDEYEVILMPLMEYDGLTIHNYIS